MSVGIAVTVGAGDDDGLLDMVGTADGPALRDGLAVTVGAGDDDGKVDAVGRRKILSSIPSTLLWDGSVRCRQIGPLHGKDNS